MPQPTIHVEGLDELRRELRRVKDSELDQEMKAIHRELALEIARRAASKVPVGETLRLWKSIRATGTVRDAIGRAGGASVPYAPPIHWGWKARNIKPRPFLVDAAAELEPNITDRYDQEVARMLDKVIGR